MKLYTIGFTQKSAETFFGLLHQNHIQRVMDIRLKPDGQLSGFSKREDLRYFLAALVDGCRYEHVLELAPTAEILSEYRQTHDWGRYTLRFKALLDERDVPGCLDKASFTRYSTCLLCSEPLPAQCHRRLVAERLAACWPEVEIIHL
jgi:uncharacterized protein (DUF488 family)